MRRLRLSLPSTSCGRVAGGMVMGLLATVCAAAQVPVELQVTAPNSGWSSPVGGETVTARVSVGTAGLPVGTRFVGFKVFYHPEAYVRIGQSMGPLVSGLDFDDSDGTTDGFRVLRHDANVYGAGRNAFSFSVALFDGVPLLQVDGRVAFEALLGVKAGAALARYEVVLGEIEVRDGSGTLLVAPSATVRTGSLGAGDPAALTVPEAGAFTFDAASLGSAATATVRRTEDALAGSALPSPYVAAATGSWTLALSPASALTGTACLPTSHVTATLPNLSQLRLLQRADASASWTLLPTQLLPDAVSPQQACAEVTAPGTFTLAYNPAALPVELTAFSAAQDGSGVLLRWHTASETNNAGFAIEQRTGSAWQDVAYAPGRGHASGADYAHRLAEAAPGTYRFRLRQIDLDGTSTHSPEVTLVVTGAGVWLAPPTPNPVADAGLVRYGLNEAGPVHLVLFDLTGRMVALLREGVQPAGTHTTVLETAGLPAGLYVIRLRTDRADRTASVLLAR